MEQRAREFAEAAHARIDQRRKYTGEPYIAHPAAVVELVRSVPHTDEMIAAAWHAAQRDIILSRAREKRTDGATTK